MLLRPLCAIAICVSLAFSSTASAEIVTLTDTEPIIDFPSNGSPLNLPAVMNFALFDFTGQPAIETLTAFEIALTIEDGDTAVGDFDFNNLSLGLDNVNTGLLLNGFADGAEMSLTFAIDENSPNWFSDQVSQQILSNLADGQLLAQIFDATPLDNSVNTYSIFDTTIRLTGDTVGISNQPVPEPYSILVWGVVLAGLIRLRKRTAAR